jgi:CP family cyanate transporter-like MFS transporter
MNSSTADTSQTRFLTSLLLLWLVGIALRLTILAVPPVIPIIHDELNLSATQIGILTGLPSMLFAFAAVPGSLLIARLGTRAALVVGLGLTAIGGALRGALPDVNWLYAMTIAMGAGVAIMQVSMPPAVRAWLPHRIGFATAVYTNGLLIGEILPVALMLTLVLPLAGGYWQWGFVIWSVPVAVIAALVMALAPKQALANGTAPRRLWWPNWRNSLIWRLGIMLGTVNATYFATNAFLPDYFAQQWTRRMDQCRVVWIEYRTIAGLVPVACLCEPARRESVALRRLRFASSYSSGGHRIWFRLLDRRGSHIARFRCRGNFDPGAGAATVVEPAR